MINKYSIIFLFICSICYSQTVSNYLTNAQSRLLKNDLDAAIYLCNQAINLDPQNQNALLMRSEIKTKQNDFNGAISDLNLLLDINHEHAAAYFERGLNFEKLSDRKNACNDFKKAFELGIFDAQNFIEKNCDSIASESVYIKPFSSGNEQLSDKTDILLKRKDIIESDNWFSGENYFAFDIPLSAKTFKRDSWFIESLLVKTTFKSYKDDGWFNK